MRTIRHCTCGGTFEVTGDANTILWVLKKWLEFHRGEGHGKTDARTARNARRRQYRAWERELRGRYE